MACLLGIDLGTSSVKSVLLGEEGDILAIGQEEYAFDIPREGWAEQDPEVWWNATVATIKAVLSVSGVDPREIVSIGFSGQMHGLVPLSRDHRPVRKAIIWCDQRSREQVEEIMRMIGPERLGEIAHSPIATGFQTASLVWMKEHEPTLYDSIQTVVLPKDYVRFRLTGELSTDVTDAAGTLALDVNRGTWSKEILGLIGLREDIYPPIFMPETVSGEVTRAAAALTGLAAGTKVVHGGADQVMTALGNGIVTPGDVSVTIGTGGQVLSPLSRPIYDARLRAHSFNYFAPGTWYFMGAALSAGLSLRWLRTIMDATLPYREIDEQIKGIPVGSEGLIFLPYLSGERTPHMDPHARGMFFGLTLNHGRRHLMRAVMEGVVFSLRDCMGILIDDMHQECNRVIASGGGAQSKPWLQIQADVFNREIYTSPMKEQAGVGAAITAGVGIGCFGSYEEACGKIVKWNQEPCVPDPMNVERYEGYYRLFRELYTSNKEAMRACGALSRNAWRGKDHGEL